MKLSERGGGARRQLRAPALTQFVGRLSWPRRFPLVTLLCVALLFVFSEFVPSDSSQVQAQERGADEGLSARVLSLERLWNEAEIAKDTQSLNHLLTDTFVYADIDGSVLSNKAEFLHSVTDRSEHIESIRSESMLTRVYGETVIVTGIYHEKGTINGKPYTRHGRFTDTWVKQGSGWMCAASQSTLLQK